MAQLGVNSDQSPPHDKGPEVTAEQILSSIGDSKDKSVDLTPIQKAGMNLIIWVGSAILLVIIALLVDWFINAPHLLPLLSTQQSNSAALEIDTYKQLGDLAIDRFSKIFDLVISKALLPVFTTILGYLFGARTESKEDK